MGFMLKIRERRHLNFVNKQTQQFEKVACTPFQNITVLLTMPPKSDYWKYFAVQGVLAVCQLQGCPKPNVSLGALPKPGEKKRISEYILYISAALYHCAFLQHLGQSPTTWPSTTNQSGTPIVRRETGKLRQRLR